MLLTLNPLVSRLPEGAQAAVRRALELGTWSAVRRALVACDDCPPEWQGPEVAVHILASFNVEPIESALRLGLRCMPCRARLEIAPLDTIEQQIHDTKTDVYHGKYLANVILWRTEE